MSAEMLGVPRPFCVALSPSVHWNARFLYSCALHIFSILGFRQWRSRADRVVNLNTTIRFPLFWRTWTRARARTLPHGRAWHMGRNYSDCRASELTDRQVSSFVYSWFLESTEKNEGLVRDFSKAHAPDCPWFEYGFWLPAYTTPIFSPDPWFDPSVDTGGCSVPLQLTWHLEI